MRHGMVCVLCVGIISACVVGCEQKKEGMPTSMRGKAPAMLDTNEITEIPTISQTDLTHSASPEAETVTMPEVELPQNDLEKCLVRVNDTLPTFELPMPGDTVSHSFDSLKGAKATVLLVWNPDDLYSIQALETLQTDLLPKIQQAVDSKEVAILAVASATTSEAAGAAVANSQITYPVLLDTDGSWCAKVTTDKPFRVFLLDATGKILWFDIECSDSTLRDLTNGLHLLLK